ncbi:MAG: hypothetical protein JF589_10595 [Gemmatimonadetes bacterium]|nr:hypothetical protein [Gemmatimonadota bacterium]
MATPDASRYLVVACPTPAGTPSASLGQPTDSATRALVAALEASAATDASMAHPARHADQDEHGDHDEHAHDALRSADEKGSGEDPDAPFAPQFKIHLFADMKYAAIDTVGSRNGFSLGQFDLFGRSELSDALSVIAEATLTALPRNTFSAHLERLMLTYSPTDLLSASVGRYHTGIGYYNTAYHHGTWFQTATGRPLMYNIDGDIGVIPIHTLGVSATGAVPSGSLGLHYLAEFGSGRAGQASAAGTTQPALNDNNTPSMNGALWIRPDAIDGLQLGVSLYHDRLTFSDTSKARNDETIAAAHIIYKTDVLELMTEGMLMRHDPRGAGTASDSHGYYAQASRRFGSVRPYARMDYLEIPKTDPLFAFLGRRFGPSVGVRYDFQPLAALKLQTSHLNQTTRPNMNRFDAQVSFMF